MKNAHLFDPVLAWLDAGADPDINGMGFNMAYGVRCHVSDFSDRECGTVCCIAGAICLFNHIPYQDVLGTAQHNLDLTDDEAWALFYGDDLIGGDELPNTRCLDQIRPDQAAATIRHFIETGDVRW